MCPASMLIGRDGRPSRRDAAIALGVTTDSEPPRHRFLVDPEVLANAQEFVSELPLRVGHEPTSTADATV
jgi:hypothetical protein